MSPSASNRSVCAISLGRLGLFLFGTAHGLFLVTPDELEEDVRAQLRRPAFSRVFDLHVCYLP